jgi:hypothetical protein
VLSLFRKYHRTHNDDFLIELPALEQSLNASRRCHRRDYPTLGEFAPEPKIKP